VAPMWQVEESRMRATSLRSSEKPWHSAIIFDEPVTGDACTVVAPLPSGQPP
jgi:hypothetical protein